MEQQKYNQAAKLTIDPQPDTMIRVFMMFKVNNKIQRNIQRK
jgi:hypothetical protein